MQAANKLIVDQNEERVMILAAQKNQADFSPLYERCFEPVFRFVYQRIDNKDAAYDITADVFIKALSFLPKFEYRGIPFLSWLFRIAQNELNSMFRANKLHRNVNLEDSDLVDIKEEIEIENNLDQDIEKLVEILGELEISDLQIIEMRYFEKRSFKEIGEILEITENNAKVKCYRILGKMGKMIKNKS